MLLEYEKYIEKLLRSQYSVSDCIQHKGTRGATREDFFKEQLRNVLPKYRIVSGIIVDDLGVQSPQCDCIIINSNTTCRRLGNQEMVHAEDVLFLVEVKSTIRGGDLKKFNNDLKKVKKLFGVNPNFRGILIGFNSDLQLKTLYTRFGYKYYRELDTFKREVFPGKSPKKTKVDYENIDAVVNLDANEEGDESFFIQRVPDAHDVNHYFVNECAGDEYAFGQFLKMIK